MYRNYTVCVHVHNLHPGKNLHHLDSRSKLAPGCKFLKHRSHGQICIPGANLHPDANLHPGANCAHDIDKKHKLALTRFRTSSHSLMTETGRYENTPREQRICQFCNMGKINDEYHFLLVCPNYRDLRRKFFKPYFCHRPTLMKFETLLSKDSEISVTNL